MNSDELDQRLSQLATRWSMVIAAHAPDGNKDAKMWTSLLDRYRDPVFRYLLGAVRDFDAAEELAQDFVVRFLRGDFHRATPEKGRFRDYVKRSLVNLVNDYYRDKRRQPGPLPAELAGPEDLHVDLAKTDVILVTHLREELLTRTWDKLREFRASYYLTLRMRVEDFELSSRQIADRLKTKMGKSISPDTVRKTLERSRRKFADLLVDEVAASMDSPTAGDLHRELQELDLLRYCRTSLQRRPAQ
jgi:RNA polymerase sigma factor (sigma-70 family)